MMQNVDLPKCKKDFSSYRIHLDAHITTIVDGNRNSVKRDSSAMFLLALLRLGGSWCVFVLKYCLGCGRVFLTPGPLPGAQRVPHFLVDTGVLVILVPRGTPKGRPTKALGNAQGRKSACWTQSSERARWSSWPQADRRSKRTSVPVITPFQGLHTTRWFTWSPRPLAWAVLGRPFRAECMHLRLSRDCPLRGHIRLPYS